MPRRDDLDRPELTRRTLLRSTAAAAAVGVLAPAGPARAGGPPQGTAVTKGRVRQSACRWCYGSIPIDELAGAAKRMGLVGIDLLRPEDFEAVKAHGLICTMTSTHDLARGLNDPANHDDCLAAINAAIEATAKEGWRNVITFSGNRNGLDDRTGLEHCAKALREVVPVAEQAGVVINMELLNSKVDHPDYMCDTSAWGVELVKRVGSDHFKLLYDIYHMQIMEGDIIRTIERDHPHFGHYHTGGNPGRHELDETQELFYPAICRAIVDTGFDGFLAQEFIPTRDPLTSLAEAVTLCDV
ncbi:hydroxypyruvate isomerase family protein [Tautonia plasticadhaerens]|uniref:Hydroxypyruvate isomerase n=1 Tax=Tautonia plasticadhaerens TaxID=2527974 RepID=A0A518H4T3_9BACT|nr:TIM barrel protein [Tautonia plasticadhaerens]QDV35838.1 Hydroxypyruvate isomerase [Tautonia plasticadhaerens]